MSYTRWWLYVQQLIGDDTAQDAAAKAGFDKSAFTRWKNGAGVDPHLVVKVARAYNANTIEALVEAEFITAGEAQLREVQVASPELLRSIDGALLAEEVTRRLCGGLP